MRSVRCQRRLTGGILKKADWLSFQSQYLSELTVMSAEDPAGQFNDLLIQAAEKTISKTLFNHLPNSALSVLLKVYNHVWKSGHRGAKR